VRDIVAEFIAVKTRALRSARYLRQLRVSLRSFSKGRANAPLADVKVQDVEAWLFKRKVKVRTMKGNLGDVRSLLTWAKRRGYIPNTDAGAADLPPAEASRPPGIHTPEQVRQVLETARRESLDVMRHLAIRYFAGVRSAECHRLREEDVHGGFVDVPGTKAKTRSRRVVKIQPNLEAWLALGGTLRPLGIMTVRKVIKKAGVPWPHNVTRHSFASYHLAMWSKANETALEAGHSEQMLFANYRQVVLPSSAREFWSIVPT
jgi:integrase